MCSILNTSHRKDTVIVEKFTYVDYIVSCTYVGKRPHQRKTEIECSFFFVKMYNLNLFLNE